ncbi:MAG: heme-binding protein [Erythrobacter sp.]
MKIKTLIATGVGLALVGSAAAYAQYSDIEQPGYEMVTSDGPFELREYAPMLVAEVTHTGQRSRALNAGFRRLAAYIFAQERPGANTDAIAMTSPVLQDQTTKIAMTSPVMQDEVEGETDGTGTWRTRFIMPAQYTLETLPQAAEDITLDSVPGRHMAAVRFRGYGRDTDLVQAEAALREWMAEQELTASGPAEFAFYDAPMVPGPMRRNEVMIPVAMDASREDAAD